MMTTDLYSAIEALLASDLSEQANRLVLADALAEAGRGDEAAEVRGADSACEMEDGTVAALYEFNLCTDAGAETVLALDRDDAIAIATNGLSATWAEYVADIKEIDGAWAFIESGTHPDAEEARREYAAQENMSR